MKVFGVETYTISECDSTGHNSVKSGIQDLDGVAAVKARLPVSAKY